MSVQNVLASVAVRDLNSAAQWYETLLGMAPERLAPELAEWKFERGGWLQVYELPVRAGRGSFTLDVSDIEEQIAELNNLGIDTGDAFSSDRVRTVMITDPDGNHIAFAQALDPLLAE